MKKTVLIVDDNLVERIVLTGFLHSDYNIIEAESGEEAIEMIQSHFDYLSAVVMDVVMPGMDGYETLMKIKANTIWLHLPVIITTSMDDDTSREKAIALGADGFVTKPYNRALLLHVLESTIKLRESTAIADILWRDKLTGLLNRDSFFMEAESMIKKHEPGYYIISCLDVEHFKVINDQYGTKAGDKVLIHIANCLNEFVAGTHGLTCRYMADRFAILFPASKKDEKKAEEIHIAVSKPKCINYPLKIRIGRCIVDDFSLTISAMYDRASMAQATIKDSYDTYIATYNASMMDQIRKEQHIVNSMEHAIENGEFEPWLQPQYNHSTGALVGAEALVRWNKEGKYIYPFEFIPVFERNGFIYKMDQNIWEQVCILLRKWLDAEKKPLPISVNISRRDLFHKNFVSVLTGIVDQYRIPYDLIRLEITESAFAESSVIDKVNELINLGFTIEIDDFGSGYSSLNTLKDVPATILKLDMKFFNETKNKQRSGIIIESVVRMAKWLGMSIIAEGVEVREQADYLKSIGCYCIQGYFYAKPMTVSEYERLLEKDHGEAKLEPLKTLAALDNNEFWNSNSIDTLIFNSYVGGACIFEYHNGRTELLRMNDRYTYEMGGLISPETQLVDASIVRFIDEDNRSILKTALLKAIETKKEASCEVCLSNGKQTEYIQMNCRIIAQTNERYLCYGVVQNISNYRKNKWQEEKAEDKKNQECFQFVNEILQEIFANSNRTVVMPIILHKILQHFEGHRVYIMEDSNDHKTMSCTYELCKEGIDSVRSSRRNLSIDLFELLHTEYIAARDIQCAEIEKSNLVRLLSEQGVCSLVIVPLLSDSQLIGAIGIDNPNTAFDSIHCLQALGNCMTRLLS